MIHGFSSATDGSSAVPNLAVTRMAVQQGLIRQFRGFGSATDGSAAVPNLPVPRLWQCHDIRATVPNLPVPRLWQCTDGSSAMPVFTVSGIASFGSATALAMLRIWQCNG